MKPQFRILLIAIMAILLVACSAESEPEEVEYTIEMTEFSYAPEDIELKVGQTVTLNLVNLGQLDHEIMIGREVKMDNSLPAGYELDMFEHAGVEPVVVMEMHENEHMRKLRTVMTKLNMRKLRTVMTKLNMRKLRTVMTKLNMKRTSMSKTKPNMKKGRMITRRQGTITTDSWFLWQTKTGPP
jgi:plastocyanin